ncbi:unnamed protein product [Sphagnum balticum]
MFLNVVKRFGVSSVYLGFPTVHVAAVFYVAKNARDGMALLDVKRSLVDQHGALSNWNASDRFPCNWEGVYCSNSSSSTFLDLSNNNLTGSIPPEIGNVVSLQILYLGNNGLSGSIPPEIGNLSSLEDLVLWDNHLEGGIPPELGNCSHLQMLALYNNLLTGTIPQELGKLQELQELYIYTNSFSGTIPKSFGNLTSVLEIDLSENNLTGDIPGELGYLPRLRLLHLFENKLTGQIPLAFGSAVSLTALDLSINQLTGNIPLQLQRLPKLSKLQLFRNNLVGEIPPLFGSFSNLTILEVSNNQLTGSIPPQLCQAKGLMWLHVGKNNLSGTIPPALGSLWSLQMLSISDNNFTGSLPEELGQLQNLVSLNVSDNALTGSIPPGLGNCTLLQLLDLSNNLFAGGLPTNFGNFFQIESLSASNNQLTGSIPDTLSNCTHLSYLQLGGNLLSGVIPQSLGKISSLQYGLNLSHNALVDNIPAELGNLVMLQMLDLSFNKLTGPIPSALGNLTSIQIFNVSYNQLSGPLPNSPIFQRLNTSSFVGNPGLCGAHLANVCPMNQPLPMPLPPNSWQDSNVSTGVIVGIIAAVIGGAVLIILAGACWLCRRQSVLVPVEENPSSPDSHSPFPKTDFTLSDLVEATDNFGDNAEIGRGACGKVYKACLPGRVIAVKKLSAHMDGPVHYDSFTAEIMTLGKIRHRNIVKLLGFCSHQGFNLLLYEYMPKGSLGELLGAENCLLDWDLRYKVAVGAAEGLAYLHHDCKPQIIHRDIKSNNILLDDHFEAHVGDFGLAKLIDVQESKSMSAIAGSYGYIAPEYAYTMKVTEKCDIYSFGVVLLELLTGRRPIQPIEEGGDLVTWVNETRQSSPVTQILDSRMELSDSILVDEMELVLKVALFCTNIVPAKRPTMREVVSWKEKSVEDVVTLGPMPQATLVDYEVNNL